MKNFISRLFPPISGEIETIAELERRYRHFFRGLTILLLALVLIPLIFISFLSYTQYKKMLEEEEVGRLLLNVEQAENTVELFVVKLHSVINFAAHEDRYQELLQPGGLHRLFVRLRNAFPDFTDIEVIGPDGRSAAREGGESSPAHNYTGQPWYQQTLRKGSYISNIFTGFRGAPHFVVAVARPLPNGGHWVMRVNIDGKTLQRYIDTVGATAVDDLFLVDQNGILQTKPKRYGARGEKCIFPPGRPLSGRSAGEVQRQRRAVGGEFQIDIQVAGGKEVLRAARPVGRTPWRLVMVKEVYSYGHKWLSFRNRLLLSFLCCAVVAVLIIVVISRAITSHIRNSDRKRQQFLSEAENSNKLASIGRLAAGVAHEINNPLAIINQKAGLMADLMEITGDFEHKKAMAEALSGIDNSVERCRAITHRLLGFARHTDVRSEEIDINELLQNVTAFVEKEASYSQVEIISHFADGLPALVSDQGQLQQVFLNILNNAVDAIGTDGRITITTAREDAAHLRIEIADTGCGMSAETLARLFEPFYTTKPVGKGTGLGMSISYGIIKKLGGRIKVSSTEGEGTCFTFVLPLKNGENQAG